MNTHITAKDFFVQLGAMAALYAGVIALINLLFRVINVAYPTMSNGYSNYYYYGNPISLPVATLIIVFPVFLFLSWLLQKNYSGESNLRESGLRKWLVYLTLFVSGIVVVGDLVTLLYHFLDGQEMTTGFLLKVLAVFVVAGSVFGYYLADLRNKLTPKNRTVWRIYGTALVLASIVLGFMVVGSPASQRALRNDAQRIQNLEGIQWQLINYYQMKEALPATLSELADPLSGWIMEVDPKTKEPFEYEKTGNLSFKLCAVFEKTSAEMKNGMQSPDISKPYPAGADSMLAGGGNWDHEAGRTCFDRTIDPDRYPAMQKSRMGL